MSYDARIIVGGQGVDVMGAMGAGNALASQTNELRKNNALAELYRTQGPGIVSGDQGAMNALAQLAPDMAMGYQQGQLGMESTRLDMDRTRQQMAVLDENTKREAEMYARSLGAEKAAAEAAELEAGVKQALMAPTPEAFDAMMTQMGRPEMVGQFENRDVLAAQFMSVAEILKQTAPTDPMDALSLEKAQLEVDALRNPPAPKPADDYQRYVAEETAAGRQPLGRIEYSNALKGNGVTQTITNPDGTTTTIQVGGAGASGAGGATVGQVYNPNEVANVVTMIDEIMADPNLDSVLGNKAVVLGGGNQVADMNMAQRLGYGTGGLSAIERIGQLQSNAWLSARAMLKGGGAITDYESKKAEAAVARLERPKSAEDFKLALKDLRDAITEGEAKLRGGAAAPPPPPAEMSDEDFLKALGLE